MLRAYNDMRPRIEAERQLQAIKAARIGAGRLEKSSEESAIRALEREANLKRSGQRMRTVGQWAAAGMNVIYEGEVVE